MNIIKSRFGRRLFASYLLLILIGMGTIWVTTRFTTPRAYARHMSFLEQSLVSGDGMGRMMGQGGPGGPVGMMGDFQRNFQDSFNESLILSFLSTAVLALFASWFFSRAIVAPIRSMQRATLHIAEGNYAERVHVQGVDELSELASSFNRMAENLEGVETMRRRLIGDVAHELRTPLTAIKGSAEGLIDGVLPAGPETYGQIQREVERLSRLVADLEELSRVESGSIEMDLRSIDASQLVETVIKRLKFQFEEKRVRLFFKPPHEDLTVLADEHRSVQVLTNLLGNALHYSLHDGEVIISIEKDDRMARFTICDSGVGLAPDQLTRIFDRFYRVDKSRSRAGGGSGIGLTISKHLVEAQGGEIWAESDGINKGSVFSFTLPLG